MGKITKNYIYNLLFQLLILALPLILSPYLVRVLGADQLGIYSFVTSTANIIVTVGLLGTYNYGCRQIAYTRDITEDSNTAYNQILTIRILLGIALTIIYGIVCWVESEYSLYFLLYYSWVLSMIIDPSWFFVGQEDMKATAIKNSAVRLITVALIFLFVKRENDLTAYVAIMGFSALICNVLLFLQVKKYKVSYHFSLEKVSYHLKGSLSLFWPQVATLMYLQVDKIMLKYLTSDISQVSFYDYGEKIVTIPLTLITTLSTVMMPRIANEYANNNTTGMRELLIKAGKFSMMLAMPMMFGMAICANKLIPWYLGAAYAPSIMVIILVSPIIVTNSLSGISGNQYFVATDQTNLLLKAYVSAAILNILINAILIPKYGCNGAAIATVIAAIASVLIQYYYMHKQLNIGVFIGFSLKYFLYAFFMGIGVLLVGIKLPAKPMTSVIQILVGLAIYSFILLITKDKNLIFVLQKFKSMKIFKKKRF